jgi:hypothetical protein
MSSNLNSQVSYFSFSLDWVENPMGFCAQSRQAFHGCTTNNRRRP